MELKRKADDQSLVSTKKPRHELSVIGAREKAVVSISVRLYSVYPAVLFYILIIKLGEELSN